jgi:predicted aspartyl protease
MTSGRSKHEKQKRRDMLKAQKKRHQERASKQTTLRGTIEKSQCVLSLTVSHPNSTDAGQPIQAIIDTGATNSTIRADLVKALNLPVIGKVNCRTVHGIKEAPVVAVRIVVRDNHKGAQRIIQAIVPDEQQDEMLFGMDAMTGGVLTVDTIARTWQWQLTHVRSNQGAAASLQPPAVKNSLAP